MIEPPVLTDSPARQAAVIHLTIPRDEIQHAMGPAIGEVMAALEAQGIAPAGAWYTHHLRTMPDGWDFEVGVPVASPVTPTGRVVRGALPAARVARTVYAGGYEGLGEAWGALGEWMAAHGLRAAENLWEIYLRGPESGDEPAGYRTELNRPLAV